MPGFRKTRIRREHPNQARYLTFSCDHRQSFLDSLPYRDKLAEQIMNSRQHLGFLLHAWVIMPDHVHLLLTPPLPDVDVPRILSAIKRRSATLILADMRQKGIAIPPRFWQPGGGYDRNILGGPEFNEKIRYIHENPVRRGLVEHPEDWAWSSAPAWGGLDARWPDFDHAP